MSRPVDYAALTEKRCPKCGQTKPISEFSKFVDPSAVLTGWRYYSYCRDCGNADCRSYSKNNRETRNERLREWRRKNPEKAKASDRRGRFRMKYKLSEEQVEELRDRFDSMCWLCLVRPAVAIDHNHATGKVRGAVCTSCNVNVLSKADADPGFLDRVAAYQLAGDYLVFEVANQARESS